MSLPSPFNKTPQPLKDGDRVIDKDGDTGTVMTNTNLDDRPSSKFEFIEYDKEVTDQYGNKHKKLWMGDIWLKKI
jgi:hypothetical protein